MTWNSEERLGEGDAAGEAATDGEADGADDGEAVGVDFAQPDSAMRSIAMISGGVRGTG